MFSMMHEMTTYYSPTEEEIFSPTKPKLLGNLLERSTKGAARWAFNTWPGRVVTGLALVGLGAACVKPPEPTATPQPTATTASGPRWVRCEDLPESEKPKIVQVLLVQFHYDKNDPQILTIKEVVKQNLPEPGYNDVPEGSRYVLKIISDQGRVIDSRPFPIPNQIFRDYLDESENIKSSIETLNEVDFPVATPRYGNGQTFEVYGPDGKLVITQIIKIDREIADAPCNYSTLENDYPLAPITPTATSR